MLPYRSDIDGLRTLAVLPVVLFHAGVAGFDGGFVGVDVFFVISGYLITSLILSDISAGIFTIRRFYERRMRRIFPALFVVVAACVPTALVILVPEHLEDFGQSVIATALFTSNFFFLLEDGYFEGAAELHPLLHTWSLAVEEQFYLLFPLLLLLLTRRNLRPSAALIGLGLLSFGINLWWTADAPTAAFLLLPGRLWELLMGAVLATRISQLQISAIGGATATLAGLVLIGLGVFGFDANTPFPGAAALLPCIGAALIILGGTIDNPVNRLLGAKPMRGCGLISYSLYLWHFPLIVFSHHLMGRSLTAMEALMLIAVSIVLAALTWRFVEQPYRTRASRTTVGTLLKASVLVISGCIAFGLYTDFSDGAPARMSAAAQQYLAGGEDRDTSCMRKGSGCLLGSADTPPKFLVWGDSHASAILPAFREAAEETGITGFAALRGGCLPLLGYRLVHSIADDCAAHVQHTLEYVRRSNIDTVFLAARWTLPVEESMYGFEPGHPYKLTSYPDPGKFHGNPAVLRNALGMTLEALRGSAKEVVIVGPVPEIGWHVPHTLAQRSRFGALLPAIAIQPPLIQVQDRNQRTLSILREAARRYGARLLLPQEVLCSATEGCLVLDDDLPLYFDSHHLTTAGARRLTPLLIPELQQVAALAPTGQRMIPESP